jgi:membrane protein DedA with SNARE-associated domain
MLATPVELILIFLSSFGFNMIPFAGPSNLFIASNSALMLGTSDPATLLLVGFLVAIGAALAKSVHYMVTFFVSKHLSTKQRQRLDSEAPKIRKWAFVLLFTAAATPIPDEPVIIPIGLLRYSPAKFFAAFFLGKLGITVAGAFLGSWAKATFSEWLSPETVIILSVILTIIVTVILLKVDLGKLANRFLRKRKEKQINQTLNCSIS